MKRRFSSALKSASLLGTAALLLAPLAAFAQTSNASPDKWIHVRVVSNDTKGETVKVNVPLDMAEKVLPAINRDNLHDGKVTIRECNMNGVDVRAILDAVRTAKDGEFVTVQAPDADVRVAKEGGFLLIHVLNKNNEHQKAAKNEEGKKLAMVNVNPQHVEIKVPMKVVDALFSGPKDQLDVLAALRALSSSGDTELVSVKDDQNSVRVWIDSKNIAD